MIAVTNRATSSSISVNPRFLRTATDQLPLEEPLPELLPVSELPPVLVPGLRMAPVPPLLLLLLLLELPRLVPFQSGASPLAAATASPRKPTTEASQF